MAEIDYPNTTNVEGVGVPHVVTFSYAPSDGQLTIATDENGQATQYFYNDILRRETGSTSPDGNHTTISYNDQGSNPSVTTSRSNSAGVVSSTAIVDGIGHPIHLQHADPEGTIYSDTTYDGLGQKLTQSNPYRQQGEATYGIVQYNYDALGRAISITNQDGTSSRTTYAGTATEVTDEGNGSVSVQHIVKSRWATRAFRSRLILTAT
ncbi:MAG TPA: hypothetical protein VI636_09140 [Candidatus Angelobacter sp.]